MEKRWGIVLETAAAAAVGGGLLVAAGPVGEGVRQGLAVCATVLLPSLFPFLILTAFVSVTRISRGVEKPIGWLVERVYGCPRGLGTAVLMSWVGGYPAGARVLRDMVDRGRISPRDAGRALTFCINSGPAFLVAVVGLGVFGGTEWGFFLLGCQLAAGVLTGRILCRGRPIVVVRGPKKEDYLPLGEGFVTAVGTATRGMISICAFVVAFSAIGSVLEAAGVVNAWCKAILRLTGGALSKEGAACFLRGLLEIGGGCGLAQGLSPGQAALVLPFLLSFSSLSVMGQVGACFGEGTGELGLLLPSRLLHGALTALLATPLLYSHFRTAAVMMTGRPMLEASDSTILGTVCLLMMCAMLAAAIGGEKAG